jgi:hypothetical protein
MVKKLFPRRPQDPARIDFLALSRTIARLLTTPSKQTTICPRNTTSMVTTLFPAGFSV